MMQGSDDKKELLMKALADRKGRSGLKIEIEKELRDPEESDEDEVKESEELAPQSKKGPEIVETEAAEINPEELDPEMIKAMLGNLSPEQAMKLDPKSLHEMAIVEMMKSKKKV